MTFVCEDELKRVGRFQGEKILVADDNDLSLKVVKMILEDWGLRVTMASDGEEVLQQYLASKEYEYRAVFLDIHMPRMDGYETTLRLRCSQRSDSKEIPIYAISADDQSEDKQYALDVGMNGYITKPIKYSRLFRLMCHILENEVVNNSEKRRTS